MSRLLTVSESFDDWWETFGQPYEAAVIERGGTPWTTDTAERRELWGRRHQRPAPPADLTNNLDQIRGKAA
jgi:hypothetical protein